MKTLIAVIFSLTSLISGTANGQWQWLSPHPTGVNLANVSFVNNNTGFIVSSTSAFYKTTDGGNTWNFTSERNTSYPPEKLQFTNDETGFMNYIQYTEEDLYKTSNGGMNWFSCFSYNQVIYDFDFINENTGFTTSGLIVYKTTDAGNTWTDLNGFPEGIRVLDFYNSSFGIAAPYYSGAAKFWVTSNGGLNWSLIQQDFTPLNTFYVNENIIYASDYSGRNYKSTNSGLNWVFKSSSADIQYFENDLTGYALYGNELKKTTDGANSWNTIVQSDVQPTHIVDFKQNSFYSVGNGGYIVKSDDRGLTWHSKAQSVTGNSRSLFFADNNTGVIAGDDNIIKTIDGGNSWTQIMDLDSNGIQDLCSPDDQYLCAACKSGYFGVSSDFGNSWNFSYTGFPVDFSKVYFVNHNTGFLIKYNSDKFYSTQDGGATWTENYQIPKVRDISFTDNLTGYAISNENNFFYKTTDGGVSWFTSSSFPFDAAGLRDLIFTGSGDILVNRVHQNSWSSYLYILYTSTDLGITWNETFRNNIFYISLNNVQDAIYNLQLTNDNSIIAQYGNSAIKSEDNGVTWRDIIYPHTTEINYFFPTSEIGFIAGNNIIGKIENGGTVSINNISSNSVPKKFHLYQNYPNPFNPSTNLEFGISELGFVSLKVYNSLGMEVATIVNEVLSPGSYNYQFSTVNYQLPSGVYFYRLESGGFVETKRMVLLK